jgi:hypothetical protein
LTHIQGTSNILIGVITGFAKEEMQYNREGEGGKGKGEGEGGKGKMEGKVREGKGREGLTLIPSLKLNNSKVCI